MDAPCSAVHMEEASVMQGAQGMLVQNWPTVSSAAEIPPEAFIIPGSPAIISIRHDAGPVEDKG
ncbi:hypothetical protein CRUP_036060, partial [Coryphaenoides rupestris]